MDETKNPADNAAPPPETPLHPVAHGHGYRKLPLVGIGGAAGSLSAVQALLGAMPTDSGMAFVLLLHLAPEQEAALPALLQCATAMPVVPVRERCKVEPDTVYLGPSGSALRTYDGALHVSELPAQGRRQVAVDLFFRSLADAHGPYATAIVLSGADGDGAVGIKRIKERGGLTVAQDPASAEFGGMPRSAIATGMVDWVLAAGEIPPRLLDYRRREQRLRLPSEATPQAAHAARLASEANALGGSNTGSPGNADEAALRDVLGFLRTRTGRDFAYYKRATILRRIARRMQINGVDDLPGYLDCLRTSPGEAGALLQDLLISVTNFFRDPESFAALVDHLPDLFEGKGPGDAVRVWVAACATGEEAYSIAMLLNEHARTLEAPPMIQVFASDLDDAAIKVARAGLYAGAIEADLSQERLHRYFSKEHGGYRLRRDVRETVLFAVHDVLKDSPFSRLDLVTCRNLLIYLDPAAQRRVLDTFHFSLKPGGLMFLGSSESVDDGSPQFAVIDKKHRLYAQRSTPRAVLPVPDGPGSRTPAMEALRTVFPEPMAAYQPFAPAPHFAPSLLPVHLPAQAPGLTPAPAPASPAARVSPGVDGRVGSWGELHFRLLEQIAPPSVLVDADYDIVHLSPGVGGFLRHAAGKPSRNLLRVIHPGLRIELRAALYQAAHRKEGVEIAPMKLDIDGVATPLSVRVTPANELAPGYLLVVLRTAGAPPLASESIRSAVADDPVADHLDREMERMKLHLRDTVEQYEASTEELKASNEELHAMNEELRSATEELETSREELQSINEELTTVNHELKTKVDELGHANSDMHNLMDATAIATIFLDRNLCITRFTPSAVLLFNLIATDIGRPLSDLATQLDYADLAEDARRVLARLVPIEREVGKAGGQWFLVRALPYRTLDDHIAGVVLTFVDVTERKQGQEALRISQERFGAIVNQAAAGVVEVALDGRIAFVNRSYRRMLGYGESDMVGLSLYQVTHPDDAARVGALFRGLAEQGEPFTVEARQLRQDGSLLWTFSSVARLTDIGGRPDAALVMCIDITERKKAEDALSRSEERLRLIVDNAVEFAIFSTDPDMRITRWNIGAQQLLGYAEAEVLGQSADLIFTAADRAAGAPQHEVRTALAEGRAADERLHRRKDASTFWASGALMPMLDGTAVVGFVKILRDQSQARQSRQDLEQSRAELVEALQQKQVAHEALKSADAAKDRFLAVLSHELRNPLASIHSAAHAMRTGRLEDGERQQAADIMARQSQAMKSLLDDLLDISRLRLGRLVLHRQPVVLAAAVRSGAEATAPALAAAGHRLQIALPEAPVVLDADPVRFAQVLSNLLANAIRYTPPGGDILLRAEVQAQTLVVRVEDNGVGMEAGSIEPMFEMFAQQAGGAAPARGLGIGLALVRNIMELHGGTVEGSSAGPGRGCSFTLRLPLPSRPPAGAAPAAPAAPEDGSAWPALAPADGSPPTRVLVVDDNADAAWSISKLLQIAGCEVRTADSGEAALAQAAQWWPDAVVLDIGLPDIDGHEVARRLRAQARADGSALLLIAATGWGQASDRQAATDAGFDAHLVKPVDQHELRGLIAEFRRQRAGPAGTAAGA